MNPEFPVPGYGTIELKLNQVYAELHRLFSTRSKIVIDPNHNHEYSLATIESYDQEKEEITVSFVNYTGKQELATIGIDEYLDLKHFRDVLLEKESQKSGDPFVDAEREQIQSEKNITHNLKLLTDSSPQGYRAHYSNYSIVGTQGKTGLMYFVRVPIQFHRLTGEIFSFGENKEDVPPVHRADCQTGELEVLFDAQERLQKTKEDVKAGRHNASLTQFSDLGRPLHRGAAKVLAQTMARFNEQFGADFSEEMGKKELV
ncbi:MAG: hypothetical protein KAZ30_03810 [Candidatus Magasanikbacteria bacterium]|nr:hypothetical protein [Candidatus Magasanikbacteria bacterium]